MTQHTPGPWKTWNDSACPQIRSDAVGSGYYGTIASVTQRDEHPVHGGAVSHQQATANACLIAAAPELLAALESMIYYHDAFRDKSPVGPTEADDTAAARAAIAKARGEVTKCK
jgi:hypothetical protein